MNRKYDAVLFDFDGTIADTGVGIFNSIRFAIAALGFKVNLLHVKTNNCHDR